MTSAVSTFFRTVVVAALFNAAFLIAAAKAQDARRASGVTASAKQPDVDTEHIFGFTEGSDIGAKGDLEGEAETNGGLGKRSGRYSAVSQLMQLKYSISDDFRIAPTIAISHHDIGGVPGLNDRQEYSFQGTSLEMRYRLINRVNSPFGFTLSANPSWARRDDATGQPVQQYGAKFAALFDKEILKDRTFAAFDILYEPRWSRLRETGTSQADSTFGLGAAVTNRIASNIYLGGEVRYFRAYEGAALDRFAGHGLFAGPTLYWILSERTNLTLAWNAQVAGKAVDDPGSLDLVNFEKHRVRVRFGMDF